MVLLGSIILFICLAFTSWFGIGMFLFYKVKPWLEVNGREDVVKELDEDSCLMISLFLTGIVAGIALIILGIIF